MQRQAHMDVTGRVDLANPEQVCRAVCDLLCPANAAVDRALLERAFDVFSRLYSGTLPGYHRCETMYHDMRHALDVTLAAARLMAGHERLHRNGASLGAERLTLGIIVALFHDAGYIRRRHDRKSRHGAQYTRVHVTRGGRFLAEFLNDEGYATCAERAVKLIHFTGYEIRIDRIRLKDPLDRRLGALIGTADLIAQTADRAYLEKCRNYLFEEFELGGMTRSVNPDGSELAVYCSPDELLQKTPAFFENMVMKRLDHEFGRLYKCMEALFDGRNPYFEAIDRNIRYLRKILDDGSLAESLRRQTEPVLSALADLPVRVRVTDADRVPVASSA